MQMYDIHLEQIYVFVCNVHTFRTNIRICMQMYVHLEQIYVFVCKMYVHLEQIYIFVCKCMYI